jgi:hypothetical protein
LAEAALRAEQAARATAERALADALDTVRRLQTQLAHTEMARAEALQIEGKKQEASDQALLEATRAREKAEDQLAPHTSVRHQTEEVPPTIRATSRSPAARNPPKAMNPGSAREPEPVKWWLSSKKARRGKRQ